MLHKNQKTPQKQILLHESTNTTKQYHVSRKSKHHQTVLCFTKVKTPPKIMMFYKNQNTTKRYTVAR